MVIEGLREANRYRVLALWGPPLPNSSIFFSLFFSSYFKSMCNPWSYDRPISSIQRVMILTDSRSITWGCLMQSTGYGFIMPLYGIFHLLTSRTAGRVDRTLAQAIRVPDLTALKTLPWSPTIDYIIPTILMAIPLQSNTTHQWLGGFWQIFPVWVTFLQYVFRFFYVKPRVKRESKESNKNLKGAITRTHQQYVLHNAYLFSFLTSAVCHLGTLAIVGARWLTPVLFSPLAQDTLSFREVFIPPPFYLCAEMKSMAAGINNFFQYDQYIGSAAAIVWAVALNINSRKCPLSCRGWVELAIEIVGSSIVAGPGGALVALMWHRDERLLYYSGSKYAL